MYPRGGNPMAVEDRRGSAPYGLLFVIVVVLVVVVPSILGEQGEALTEFIPELISPVVLLLLPIILLLTIQFLSSESGSCILSIFSSGGPESIHQASGSPVGVALFLVLVLLLLYNRISIFGGDGDSDE